MCGHARGLDVVRLHSGEPSIYGTIAEQMDELDHLGIEYEVVPGISSFQAAAAVLRTELTSPETLILTRARGRTPMPACQELAKLAAAHATLCIFLSTGRVEEVVSALMPEYGGECSAAIVYHATWPDQQVIQARLADLAAFTRAAGLGKTAIILVGEALARPATRSCLYDATFSHEYRKAGQP